MPRAVLSLTVLLVALSPLVIAQDDNTDTSAASTSFQDSAASEPTSSASFSLSPVTSPSLVSAIPELTVVPSSTAPAPLTTVDPCPRYRHTGFWDVDILTWELDPKICGPPLSYNATTDKSRLPIEICAVVGAYLFLVFGLGSLLLTVGRRARRIAQGYVAPPSIEMMDAPYKKGFEPMSPTSQNWFKKSVTSLKSIGGDSARHSKASAFARSPVAESISSFDARVLRDDRDSRAADLERLYAAVMAHDEARQSKIEDPQVQVHEIETEERRPSPPRHASPRVKPNMRLNLSVASTIVPDATTRSPTSDMTLPLSPRSPMKAIYPPGHRMAGPTSPLAMAPPSFASLASPTFQRVELPNDMYPASPPPAGRSAPMTLPPPPSSGLPLSPRLSSSRGSQAPSIGGSSTRSRKTPNIKNLRIGGPPAIEDDDRIPLTPRAYNPSHTPEPLTSRTTMTDDTVQTTESDYRYESLDQPAPLPLSPRHPPPFTQQPTIPVVRFDVPPSLAPSPNPNSHSSLKSSSSNTLPFRAYLDTNSLTSPAPTKTTFLERRNDRVGKGPLTARTPMTGAIPQTPYSAYMPFTPITPITPRLVSRKERKERIKAEGKKVILEEDAVADDRDMWE